MLVQIRWQGRKMAFLFRNSKPLTRRIHPGSHRRLAVLGGAGLLSLIFTHAHRKLTVGGFSTPKTRLRGRPQIPISAPMPPAGADGCFRQWKPSVWKSRKFATGQESESPAPTTLPFTIPVRISNGRFGRAALTFNNYNSANHYYLYQRDYCLNPNDGLEID